MPGRRTRPRPALIEPPLNARYGWTVAVAVARHRLRAPDLEAWLHRGEQALESPYPAERGVQKVVRST